MDSVEGRYSDFCFPLGGKKVIQYSINMQALILE